MLSLLHSLPLELLEGVLSYLSEKELLTLRVCDKEMLRYCNPKLFHKLQYSSNHNYRLELSTKYGQHVRCLGVIKLDALAFDYAYILKTCPNIKHLALEDINLSNDIITAMTAKYKGLKSLKVGLLDKGQFNPVHRMWMELDKFQGLKALTLNYVDYQVAEGLFYSLKHLQEFQCKIISLQTVPVTPISNDAKQDDLILTEDEVYNSIFKISKEIKLKYHNPNLKHLSIESWAKSVNIDQDLITITPNNFPNINALNLVSYQSQTNFWYQHSWPKLRSLKVDFVRTDEQANYLIDNMTGLVSFKCMMWSSTGKNLNKMLYNLPTLTTLHIENCLSQENLLELAQAPAIIDLQIGVVKFNESSLTLLSEVFINAKHVQLGHCPNNDELIQAISALEIQLQWTELKVFQLNKTVQQICKKSPNLKEVKYIVPSRNLTAVQVKKELKPTHPKLLVGQI